MAVMTETLTARGSAGVYLALRKAPAQAAGLHLSSHAIGILAVAAVLYVGAYLVSLWLHPMRKCHWCGGTGKVSGAVFTWGVRRCGKCTDGLVPRLGALLFAGGAPRRARW
jgi:hypothetical protein